MALFQKRAGAPSGNLTINTAQNSYLFTDSNQVSITDPSDIASLKNHQYVQLVGGTGGPYVAPPVVSTVYLKDGVLTSGADNQAVGLPGAAIRTIGLIGASTEANNGTAEPLNQAAYQKDAAGVAGLSDYGYLSWALAFLGWRAPRFTLQGGVSGNTSGDILARVPALLADKSSLPDCIVCGSGLFGNDFTGNPGTGGVAVPSIAQGQANIKAILDAVVATGKLVIIATAQHHSGTSLPGTVTDGLTYQQYQATQNSYLRAYAEANPRCLVLDIERITSDAVTGAWRTGLSGDGLHPFGPGAAYIGSELASLLSPFCPTDQGPSNALNPFNLLGTKGFMQGSGGVVPAGFTATGGGAAVVPAGWTIAKSAILDARAPAGTVDVVARADGLGNELKVTLTSPGALTIGTTLPANTFGAADFYRGGIEARFVNDLNGLHAVGLYGTTGFAGKSSTSHLINTSHAATDYSAGRTLPTALVANKTLAFRAPRRSIDTGETTNSFFFQAYFWAEAGTIYLSRAVVRKNG